MIPVFDAEALLNCYARGVFPMAESRDDDRLFLLDPDARGVIPLEGSHLPRRLARTVRTTSLTVTADQAFEAVLTACARPRPGRVDTWINAPIQALYAELHERGEAHSLEVWQDERLVGGLYGVALGAAFFGESMFSDARDASKVALVHLIARLKLGGYRLLDAQFMTGHLEQFGATEITREAYHRRLAAALEREADFQVAPVSLTGPEALAAVQAAG